MEQEVEEVEDEEEVEEAEGSGCSEIMLWLGRWPAWAWLLAPNIHYGECKANPRSRAQWGRQRRDSGKAARSKSGGVYEIVRAAGFVEADSSHGFRDGSGTRMTAHFFAVVISFFAMK